jgi:4-hydroxy-3-methylbut-2-en-1-yl diphosphate reductase
MRIRLSNPRGFCAGVRMAVDIVDQLLDAIGEDTELYVYHEIVHNRHVVKRLRDRGAIFVETIEEIPFKAIVVFSAHGVSPEVKKQAMAKQLTCIDATCPLVTKVHAEAIRYDKRGWQILLIGHKNHQEIVGTQGEAPDAIQIVESVSDIKHLHIVDPKKLVYLTQTTLSTDDAEIIISALRETFPAINAPPTDDICYATTKRQNAVREDASENDLVLVVGSKNSSNSVRLTEISESVGTKAYLLDDVSELDSEWFTNVDSVLITAGASAPDHLVLELIDHLTNMYGGTLEGDSNFDEGMTFSMPQSLNAFLQSSEITIEGNTA